jgi:acyl-CoA thioesterase-1
MRLGVMVGLALALACDGSKKDTRMTARPEATDRRPEEAAPGTPSLAVDSPPARGARSALDPVVLMIGTSLTAGLGLDPAESYPALVQRKADSAGLHVRVVNAGLSGETSAGALRRLDWLMQGPIALVMLETGANDALRGLDVDSSRANLRAIVRKVRAARPAALVYLAQMEAPPNLGPEYTARFHEMFPAVAREERATLMPFLLDRVAGIPNLNQGDGIHPNVEGERIVADNVFRALLPGLQRLTRLP